MYRVSAVVEKEENWYVAHCVDLQVTSQGKSIEESLKNLKEAVELYIKHATDEELAHLKKLQSTSQLITTINV